MTFEDLHQAFLAYRREHGADAALKRLREFGATHLDSVPEPKWPDLLAAFTGGAPGTAAKSIAELDSAAIYKRWNEGYRRPTPRDVS